MEPKKLQIIGAAEHQSEESTAGRSRVWSRRLARSRHVLKAERVTGIPVDSAWIGISGTHVVSQTSRGIVAVGKVNGEISRQDVERAVEAAQAIATPANYEILHVIPRGAI